MDGAVGRGTKHFLTDVIYCEITNFRPQLTFIKFVSGANLLVVVFTKISSKSL